MSCYIVTLEEKDRTYRLWDLIVAENSKEFPFASEVTLRAHADNAGTIYGGQDENVSRLRYGFTLTPDSEPRYYDRTTSGAVNLTTLYIVGDADNQQLVIDIVN